MNESVQQKYLRLPEVGPMLNCESWMLSFIPQLSTREAALWQALSDVKLNNEIFRIFPRWKSLKNIIQLDTSSIQTFIPVIYL